MFPVNRDGILHIDNNAMDSLQIFKTELHPSRMGIGKAKEGLSLFGILNMAKSAPGRRLLKYSTMKPFALRENNSSIESGFIARGRI